jgi:NAD(P)-dependent dehydrogenase (short-subunit alcohol dehydrogenase family)
VKLKRIDEQVVVVLGASSGIGRETALRLAASGARVVVAARSEPGLASLVAEVVAAGGQATAVVCDVADADQVNRVAVVAEETYGRIDTWVNVAATSVFAGFEETTPQEWRRLTEVNYLGQVHGALAALPALRRAGGGALIAISSVEALVSLPMHAAYSGSKHAVEGAMDALRRELRHERAPISVTSIKPGTINTPFFANARNKMEVFPKGPPPWYQPGVVADCVLYAAEHPVRDLYAGGGGRQMAVSQLLAPRVVDAVLGRLGVAATRTHRPEPGGAVGNLDAPRVEDDRTQGDFSGRARGFSLYTWGRLHRPVVGLAAAAAAGPVVLSRLARSGRSRARRRIGVDVS